MPYAQVHYPFENAEGFHESRFPADFIAEGLDQTRGWCVGAARGRKMQGGGVVRGR